MRFIMVSLLALFCWSFLGVAIAVAVAEPDEPKTEWLPYAVLLGPLWFCVVADRKPESALVRARVPDR